MPVVLAGSYVARVRQRRRFSDPRLEVVWAAAMTLDAGLQYAFLRELATLHVDSVREPRSLSDRARSAVAALREVAEILGHSPSVKQYRALREQFRDLGLPAEGNIRRWLGGGWNDCLTRALLDTVAETDLPSRPIGLYDWYDDEQLFLALRECTKDLGHPPTMTEYLAWARRPDVLERPGRRPRSYKPFERFHGGWRSALAAAGVIGEKEARFAANGRVLPLRFAFDDSEIKEALLVVARGLGRSPRSMEYRRERKRLNDAARGRGEVELLPSDILIRARYGTWSAALGKAGLEALPPDASQSYLGERSPRYEEDVKLEWIRRAWAEVGEPFTWNAYTRWRVEVIKRGEPAVPHAVTLAKTFGSWTRAVARALPAVPSGRRRRPYG